MADTASRLSSRAALCVLAVVAGALVGCVPEQGGCALEDALNEIRPAPRRSAGCEQTLAAAAPAVEPVYVIACVDFTKSYDAEVRARALRFLAEAVEHFAQTRSEPLHLQVRQIASNSYAPESELTRLSLEALPALPQWERWHAVAERFPLKKRAIFTEYQQHFNAYHAQRSAREQTLRAFLEEVPELRSRRLTDERLKGSDILGCFSAAEQILARLDGAKHLIVASDLRRNGPQQGDGLDVADTTVSIIFRACRTYDECAAQEETWEPYFAEGAASHRFYRDEELTDPTTFDLRGF